MSFNLFIIIITMSVILTRYLYPKETVMSSLVWAVLDQNADEALFWAYELYYSGFKIDVFDLLISIHIVFYHEKYPHQTDVLYPLLGKWYQQEKAQNKKFRHHDTIVGAILMNIMYYHDEGVQRNIECGIRNSVEDIHAYSDGRPKEVRQNMPYTCSLSQLMRKRAGVNYLETVAPLTINMDGFSPVEFTLHDLKPYQTIYTKPPSVILRDACRFPLRTIGCDVCDTKKYIVETGDRSDVYEMALRYLNIPMYVMSIQEIQDKWLYYASYSPIWSKRIADYHGVIDREMQSVIFSDETDEEQFYQEFHYEPDEQSVLVQNSIGINVSYTTISWLDFYHKYGKENAVRSVVINV
jgi:hypothetical protein